ncbi:MAG TPA: ALQxL family class IV lanthipeptide [Pseudonocardiaceae bacterium]|nr:ALQxL family class IV lanthipeptide [Pseudonocardiaceae bacterium]
MEIDVDLLQMLPADEPGGLLPGNPATRTCTGTLGAYARPADAYDIGSP